MVNALELRRRRLEAGGAVESFAPPATVNALELRRRRLEAGGAVKSFAPPAIEPEEVELEGIPIPDIEAVSAGLPEELAFGDPRQPDIVMRPFNVPGAAVRGMLKEIAEANDLDFELLGNALDATRESAFREIVKGEGVTGEELLKAWGVQRPGALKSFALELATDPLLWGLYLKLAPATLRAMQRGLPKFVARITGREAIPSLKAYKALKRGVMGEAIAGRARAAAVGKELVATEELQAQVSQRLGRQISKSAIEERLGQLKRGGITTIEELDNIIRPINEEYAAIFKMGQELDIFPQDVFIKKLSKREVRGLVSKRRKLEADLERVSGGRISRPFARLRKKGREIRETVELTSENWQLFRDELGAMGLIEGEAPLPGLIDRGFRILTREGLERRIGVAERAARRFPGQAKQVRSLTNRINEIDQRIQVSYRMGGTDHMRRVYLVNELAREPSGYPFRRMRMSLRGMKQRLDLPLEWRKAHGEITKPAFPVARAWAEMTHDIAHARLFKTIAANPEWADDVARPGFKQLSNTDRLGALKGKFVHSSIHGEIEDLVRARTKWFRLMGEVTSTWKFGKVIANPATHFRNILSNSILADLGGLPLRKQPKFISKALREIRTRGKYFRAMMDDGALNTTFADVEIDRFLGSWAKLKEEDVITRFIRVKRDIGAKLGAEKARRLYAAEENVFKLAKYIHNVEERGMSHANSVDDALNWLFDYTDVPRFIHTIRTAPFGSPFITFTYKALPRVAEAALANPVRFWKYPLAFMGMNEFARLKAGEPSGIVAKREKNLPEYMKRGYYLSLPFKDKNDRTLYLDLTYILPWGDIAEQGSLPFIPRPIEPSHPIIRSAIEITSNTNLFLSASSGRHVPIWKPTDEPEQIAEKVGDYLWKQWLPSWAGIPGTELEGFSWRRIKRAVEGEFGLAEGGVNFYGEPPESLKAAIANAVFGLKTRAIDDLQEANKAQRRRLGKRRDITREMRSVLKNQSLSPGEKAKEISRLREMLRDLGRE